MEQANIECDIAIAGGGLAGCLIALAISKTRPCCDVRIIEQGAVLGGNHLWSFFDTDIASDHRWLVEPLICHRWTDYDIAFPKVKRTLSATYNSIESERLNSVTRAALPGDAIIAAQVESLGAHHMILSDGRAVTAKTVIDARGPGDLSLLQCGWQKFVGLCVQVPGGHGLTRPIVMDATVEQIDGFRFVYCLPLDAENIFIEDTYYSDTSELDVPAVRERIIAYAAAKGWHTNGGGREEAGVLPVVIGGDFDAYWASTGTDTAKAGLRSGMFHATTGYSLPNAVRMAIAFADNPEINTRAIARAHWRTGRFYRLLDTMLFGAAEPAARYKVLERFYALSPALIRRFYAGKSTLLDKARILSGKPPVPITRAIGAIWARHRKS